MAIGEFLGAGTASVCFQHRGRLACVAVDRTKDGLVPVLLPGVLTSEAGPTGTQTRVRAGFKANSAWSTSSRTAVGSSVTQII